MVLLQIHGRQQHVQRGLDQFEASELRDALTSNVRLQAQLARCGDLISNRAPQTAAGALAAVCIRCRR